MFSLRLCSAEVDSRDVEADRHGNEGAHVGGGSGGEGGEGQQAIGVQAPGEHLKKNNINKKIYKKKNNWGPIIQQ